MPKLVTFGESLVLYNATFTGAYGEGDDYERYCGGAESNVAVDLMKLGVPGVDTLYVTRLGDDDEGEFIEGFLTGKTKAFAPRFPGEWTGICHLNRLENGDGLKTYRREGSAASRLTFDDVRPHIDGASLLHVTGITPALSDTCRAAVLGALDHARAAGIATCVDVNYRPQLWSPDEARPVLEDMLRRSTIFKVGHDEAEDIWGLGLSAAAYAERFQALNGGIVVVTRGHDGALAFDGATLVEQPGYPITVVDPVGAGDAFIAGFLGGIFMEGDIAGLLALDAPSRARRLSASLRIANVCGALPCTRRGDTEAMPTLAEVEAFVRRQTAKQPTTDH
ncbi:MAG: sugar kinase [Chloroflexi bacterium]|nr:sugar kinase [Chloroflexota bacterium]